LVGRVIKNVEKLYAIVDAQYIPVLAIFNNKERKERGEEEDDEREKKKL